jgi:acyl-[acyl-carrier-protein]-phospholipid O-acyltransferase/long-chain-fatty-acid--[acyl-carrier-protein] ligase
VIDYSPADRMLNALPMFHSFGLMAGTMLPILGGIELFLYPSPLHFRILPEIAYDFNATLMLGTPTFLAGYAKLAHPYDFHRLRYVLAGGEKLRQPVRDLWLDKFGIRILEGYGVTETGPVLCLNTPLATRTGTVGKFLPGIEWRLDPVPGIYSGGNLVVRGPNLMDGYLRGYL